SLHGRNPCDTLRRKRSENMARRWREGGFRPIKGEDAHNWLGLSRAAVQEALERNRWSVVNAARSLGHDFQTFKNYVERFGFDLSELKRLNRSLRRAEILAGAARARQARLAGNHEVLSVTTLGHEVDVYDLTVEGAHNFIAGELCVHNCSDPNMQQLPRD